MKVSALAPGLLAVALAWSLSACDQVRQAGDASAPDAQAAASQADLSSMAPTGAGMPGVLDAPQPQVSPEAQRAFQAMEDAYLTDPHAQWALSAKASSTLDEAGSEHPLNPMDSKVWRATGQPDGSAWSNASQSGSGVDWLEVAFERPVQTGEIRVVMQGRAAVEAITRVDVIEEGGQYHTIWEGPSDVREDVRGNRTWFVRRFETTSYKVGGIKLTFANHASPGYKEVDAVQLVSH